MPTENSRIVQTVLTSWNSGNLESVQEMVADDIRWLEIGGLLEAEGTELQGWDQVRVGMESLFDAFESYKVEVEKMFDVEDRVVAILRETARGRTSGAEVDTRFGYVVTVRDGQVSRVEAYRDPADALAAAGVSELEAKRAGL